MGDAHDVLIRRLSIVSDIDDEDKAGLRQLPVTVRKYGSRKDIVAQGERVHQCAILVDGITARYRLTQDGKRQILAFHVPGDIPDLHSLHLNLMDHSFASLGPATVAFVPHVEIWALCRARPNVAAALWRETLIDGAILREWMVSLGRLSARTRVAHLFCELSVRLNMMRLPQRKSIELRITQNELADALGLTAVSVNRVIQDLKAEGVIGKERSRLVILDWPALQSIGQFDPSYLHFRAQDVEPA